MPETTNDTSPHHTDKLIKAVFFCISAHFLLFVMGWSGKYLATSHHVVEIVFYRNLITFVAILAFILLTRKLRLFRTKKPFLVAVRAFVGTVSLMGVFAALDHLPMAYATVLFFTSTLLTPVFAFLFLKEPVGIHRWSAVIFGMIGVIIISQPSGTFSIIGLFIALGTSCLHATIYTLLRALKTEDPLTVTFYFVSFGFIAPGLLFMPWLAKPILAEETWLFLVMGISGGLGQLSLASAYKYAPASFVTPFAYTALIWNILADILYWKYEIDVFAVIVGCALILSAQMYMIYRERKNNRKPAIPDFP